MATPQPSNPPVPDAAAAAVAPPGGISTAPMPATTAPTKGASKKSTAKTAKKATGAGTQAKKKTTTARKPKAKSKATSAASAQSIANDARAAAAHLKQQQAKNLARRTDPLWYRFEDLFPTTASGGVDSRRTEEFHALENALRNHGLSRPDVTPQAAACMLEHIRRYRQEIMSSAKKYADAAGRTEVAKADVQLAAELRHDHPVALAAQLPKLNFVAQQVNRKPLPPIPDTFSGVKLPPPPHQITARTYDVLSGATAAIKMEMPFPHPPRTSGQGSYGAIKGRQIPVKLKTPVPTETKPTGGDATTAVATTATAAVTNVSAGPTPMDTSETRAPAPGATTTEAAKNAAAPPPPAGTTTTPASTTGSSGPTPMDTSDSSTPAAPMDATKPPAAKPPY